MRHFLLHINIHFYIPRRTVLPVPGRGTEGRENPHDRHASSGSCHHGHGHTGDECGCQCHCQETGHECRCRHEKEKR